MARSEAQKKAEAKHNLKRRKAPRLPTGYLTEDESLIFERVYKHYPNKKSAIVEAVKLLDKKVNKG